VSGKVWAFIGYVEGLASPWHDPWLWYWVGACCGLSWVFLPGVPTVWTFAIPAFCMVARVIRAAATRTKPTSSPLPETDKDAP